jgi:hypothetical protein
MFTSFLPKPVAIKPKFLEVAIKPKFLEVPRKVWVG